MDSRAGKIARVAFWLTWAFDCLPALVILYFFFAGVEDGSVSSFNIVLWLGILLALAVIMLGSLALQLLKTWTVPALVLALVLAVPTLLGGLFLLVLLISHPRWN